MPPMSSVSPRESPCSSARPRDLSGLRETLRVLPELVRALSGLEAHGWCNWSATLQPRPRLLDLLTRRSRTNPARWCAKAA